MCRVCTFVHMHLYNIDQSANLCPMTARPAGLSRKTTQGSAEMSGYYSNWWTDMSTEKYRMVKERRGREGVSPGMVEKMNDTHGEREKERARG